MSGKLHSRPSKTTGKKLDEWIYRCPRMVDGERMEMVNVTVTITLLHENDDLVLRARCQELSLDIRSSDINELRKSVSERADLMNAMHTGVTWEPWLRVRVSAFDNTHAHADRVSVNYAIERLFRGIHPVTGKPMMIDWHKNYIQDWPQDGFVSETLTGGFRVNENEQTAYCPATPENLMALDDIAARMRELRERLIELLSPDNIGNSLSEMKDKLPLLQETNQVPSP